MTCSSLVYCTNCLALALISDVTSARASSTVTAICIDTKNRCAKQLAVQFKLPAAPDHTDRLMPQVAAAQGVHNNVVCPGCRDLLEVCEAQLQFGIKAEVPVFGGSRGPDIAKSISDIQVLPGPIMLAG